jgi:single-strand DNA-binding protein
MSDLITVTGLVATTPRHLVTSEGLPITSFRLASTQRRYDRGQEKWIDGDTNWFTITGFRQLATNLVGSVAKGDRVVVAGRLKIRDWENGERTGTTVEIDADAIGHDLSWGTASFTRTIAAAVSSDTATETETEAGTAAAADAEPSEPDGATDDALDVDAVPVPF